MKGMYRLGDYIFEYLVISILLIASFILILPFPAIFVGCVAYFRRRSNERLLKDIFIAIKDNFKIIIIYSILILIMFIFSALNIYYFNTNVDDINYFILIASYIVLFIAIIIFVHSPIIILNMQVTLFQLIFNCFALMLGGLLGSALLIALSIGFVFLLATAPYLAILLAYFIPLIVVKLISNNFYVLKARALKITVQELKEKEKKEEVEE